MVTHAFDCAAVICRQCEAAALHVALSPFCTVVVKALHFLRNRCWHVLSLRLIECAKHVTPTSFGSVSSALNLLRVCCRWLSVVDVWRLQYSTGTHMTQLRSDKRQASAADADTDADAADAADISADVRGFLSDGLRFGPQFGVVDSVLLHLYALCCDVTPGCAMSVRV
jgi:hypothetical protein